MKTNLTSDREQAAEVAKMLNYPVFFTGEKAI
jgi:hypothetical protein